MLLPPRRPLTSVLAVLLACALSACSSGGSADAGARGQGPDSSVQVEEPVAEPALDLVSDRVVEDALSDPRGTVEVLTRATYSRSQQLSLDRVTDFGGEPDIAVTEDLVVVAPATRLVTAVDRKSGEVVWTRRPRGLGADQQLCRVLHPSPESEVVVLLTGYPCLRFTRMDLRTGRVLGTTRLDSLELASTGSLSGTATVGPHTFVGLEDRGVSTVAVLDEEGELREVADADAIGLEGQEELEAVAGLPGSDVLLAMVSAEDPFDDTRETGELDRYIGLRVLPDASLEPLWSVDGVQLRDSLRPRARLVQSIADNTLFPIESPEGVLWKTFIRRGGVVPRLSTIDPETGAMSAGLVAPPDLRGGQPFAAQQQYSTRDAIADGDELFGVASGSGRSPLTRYDLGKGKVTWGWTPRLRTEYSSLVADLIALTSDGEHVYASGNADLDTVVVKLDRESGKVVAQWRFEDRFDSVYDRSRHFLVDDLLFWVPLGAGASQSRDYLAVTRLG